MKDKVKTELRISRYHDLCMLQVGDSVVPLTDYKISSSMRDGTELELKIPISNKSAGIMEYAVSATLEGYWPQRSITTNGGS